MKQKVKKGSITNPTHERERKERRRKLRFMAEQKKIVERAKERERKLSIEMAKKRRIKVDELNKTNETTEKQTNNR